MQAKVVQRMRLKNIETLNENSEFGVLTTQKLGLWFERTFIHLDKFIIPQGQRSQGIIYA